MEDFFHQVAFSTVSTLELPSGLEFCPLTDLLVAVRPGHRASTLFLMSSRRVVVLALNNMYGLELHIGGSGHDCKAYSKYIYYC